VASQSFLESPDWDSRSYDLVYCPDADTMLSHADFRTTERAFEKFIKLASLTQGDVYIQTRLKDHYVFKYLKEFDPAGFWEREEAERRELNWPPMAHMGELMVRSSKEKIALKTAEACFKKFSAVAASKKTCEVLGPAPATPFKARGNYRYSLLLRSPDKAVFQKTIRDCIKSNRGGAIITYNPRVT
jgi:primosomal protein N' (replication factor Y)